MKKKMGWVMIGLVWGGTFAQMRMVSHVCRTAGGFSPGIILANSDPISDQSFALIPYSQSGVQGEGVTGTLLPGETRFLSLESLFDSSDVSHFVITEAEKVLVTTTYESIQENGSPVYVHESSVQSFAWRIYPGNWDALWDGVAVVNTGERETGITIKQFSSSGNLLEAKSLPDLPRFAKQLLVLGDHFDAAVNSYFEVHADQPLAVTSISGSKDDRFLWENKAAAVESTITVPDDIDSITVDLPSFVDEIVASMAREDTDAYDVPDVDELSRFGSAVSGLLRGDISTAETHARTVGYRVVLILHPTQANDTVLGLLPEIGSDAPHGTFFVRPEHFYLRDLVFESPHPKYELDSAVLATRLFCKLNARALAVAGCHRCSNSAPSPCDGTTTVCNDGTNGPFRISDMAHNPDSFFQVFHELASQDRAHETVSVSVHGMSSGTDDPEFSCSDGTSIDNPSEDYVTNRLTAVLENLIWDAGSVKPGNGCNRPGDPNTLTGSTNVQGRFVNGVDCDEVCNTSASSASGRFLHIELSRDLRRLEGTLNQDLVIQSFEAIFPNQVAFP